MTAKANGQGFFQIDNAGDPKTYLAEKRQEISTLSSREQMVARTVLLVAETVCLVLSNRDTQVLAIMKAELDKLFNQAESILKHGVHKVQ